METPKKVREAQRQIWPPGRSRMFHCCDCLVWSVTGDDCWREGTTTFFADCFDILMFFRHGMIECYIIFMRKMFCRCFLKYLFEFSTASRYLTRIFFCNQIAPARVSVPRADVWSAVTKQPEAGYAGSGSQNAGRRDESSGTSYISKCADTYFIYTHFQRQWKKDNRDIMKNEFCCNIFSLIPFYMFILIIWYLLISHSLSLQFNKLYNLYTLPTEIGNKE